MRPALSFYVAIAVATSACVASQASNGSFYAASLASNNVQLDNYLDAFVKAKAFVAKLTNADKISLITGEDISGTNVTWTALLNKDGFAGINDQYYVSGFPMGSALAMTWDRKHFHDEAYASGREFYLMGYNLINGPVAGPLGRTPWGGRQPEAFSPDPYLSGILMDKTVTGMNEAGVITVGRHFLLNEQETNRASTGQSSTDESVAPYSSNVDDKTIHELYLWPFADGIRAGLGAVMCAMIKVNGTLSCQTDALLNGLLKIELGFPGMVMPDVNSQDNAFLSANAGLDYGSSTYWSKSTLLAGIANGTFTQARLDDMAVRNVIGFYYAGLDDGKQPTEADVYAYRNVRGDHAQLIRKVGAESLVLLKNSNRSDAGLPLSKPLSVSVFGSHAGPCIVGPNRAFSVQGTGEPVYQGHLASAGGSGQLSLSYLATPFQALSLRAAADGTMFRWIMNNTYSSETSSGSGSTAGMSMGMNGNVSNAGGPNGSNGSAGGNASIASDMGGGGNALGNLGTGSAVTPSLSNYAANSEVCLVFLNADSGEGADRTELKNDEQDILVNTVASDCNNTVVVINTVGPRLVDQWVEHENVTAILYGGLLGQESGNAIVDVLYGDVNPSGKLIHTIAKNESDYPVKICETAQCNFTEQVHIDYRYFDANNISVRYPFGHGLSYTTFTYGNLSVATKDEQALASRYPTGPVTLGGQRDLFEEVMQITTSLRNTGKVTGAEVAQLYVTYPAEAKQPPKQLRGFEKITLRSGDQTTVNFRVRRRDISFWDVVAQKWAIAAGTYSFAIGSSARDLKAAVKLVI